MYPVQLRTPSRRQRERLIVTFAAFICRRPAPRPQHHIQCSPIKESVLRIHRSAMFQKQPNDRWLMTPRGPMQCRFTFPVARSRINPVVRQKPYRLHLAISAGVEKPGPQLFLIGPRLRNAALIEIASQHVKPPNRSRSLHIRQCPRIGKKLRLPRLPVRNAVVRVNARRHQTQRGTSPAIRRGLPILGSGIRQQIRDHHNIPGSLLAKILHPVRRDIVEQSRTVLPGGTLPDQPRIPGRQLPQPQFVATDNAVRSLLERRHS